MKRENIVGRANVEVTPELEAYYRELEKRDLGALWNVAAGLPYTGVQVMNPGEFTSAHRHQASISR